MKVVNRSNEQIVRLKRSLDVPKEKTTLASVTKALQSHVDAYDREIVQFGTTKRYVNAAFLGGPPLARRAARAIVGGRYVSAALLALPAAALCATGAAGGLVLWTIGFLYDTPYVLRTASAAWEFRLVEAIKHRIKDPQWGKTSSAASRERRLIDLTIREVHDRPRRLSESVPIHWQLARWQAELKLRSKRLE